MSQHCFLLAPWFQRQKEKIKIISNWKKNSLFYALALLANTSSQIGSEIGCCPSVLLSFQKQHEKTQQVLYTFSCELPGINKLDHFPGQELAQFFYSVNCSLLATAECTRMLSDIYGVWCMMGQYPNRAGSRRHRKKQKRKTKPKQKLLWKQEEKKGNKTKSKQLSQPLTTVLSLSSL